MVWPVIAGIGKGLAGAWKAAGGLSGISKAVATAAGHGALGGITGGTERLAERALAGSDGYTSQASTYGERQQVNLAGQALAGQELNRQEREKDREFQWNMENFRQASRTSEMLLAHELSKDWQAFVGNSPYTGGNSWPEERFADPDWGIGNVVPGSWRSGISNWASQPWTPNQSPQLPGVPKDLVAPKLGGF